MDFTWLVTRSGFKRFWRKRIFRLEKRFTGYYHVL